MTLMMMMMMMMMMTTFETSVDDNGERASSASFRIVGRVT